MIAIGCRYERFRLATLSRPKTQILPSLPIPPQKPIFFRPISLRNDFKSQNAIVNAQKEAESPFRVGGSYLPERTLRFFNDGFLARRYRWKVVRRVVDQDSPGARMAAAGFSFHSVEPRSGLGRLCQGSMQTNRGSPPGALHSRV